MCTSIGTYVGIMQVERKAGKESWCTTYIESGEESRGLVSKKISRFWFIYSFTDPQHIPNIVFLRKKVHEVEKLHIKLHFLTREMGLIVA